ncbi:unnamed protein product, partial [Ectocarpus sp. 4 AP-2014]
LLSSCCVPAAEVDQLYSCPPVDPIPGESSKWKRAVAVGRIRGSATAVPVVWLLFFRELFCALRSGLQQQDKHLLLQGYLLAPLSHVLQRDYRVEDRDPAQRYSPYGCCSGDC